MSDRMTELLDEVATYADRLADSDKLADKGSMATAAALAELYEKREWVAEWLEQKPIREKKSYIGGRPPAPDSRNRFSQWLVWKQEQRQRRALLGRRTYQLLNGWEVQGYLHGVQITSEWAVRPLDWLRKQKYADRIPEVWARAIDLAGSADLVTSAHTRQALAEWKKDVLGEKGIRAAIRSTKAERDRIRAQAKIQELFADGDQEQVEQFHQWYVDFVRAQQKDVA
ncbi:MAG: hypothetical protein ACRD0W_24925 [Acidimicrobiales bacterium]